MTHTPLILLGVCLAGLVGVAVWLEFMYRPRLTAPLKALAREANRDYCPVDMFGVAGRVAGMFPASLWDRLVVRDLLFHQAADGLDIVASVVSVASDRGRSSMVRSVFRWRESTPEKVEIIHCGGSCRCRIEAYRRLCLPDTQGGQS